MWRGICVHFNPMKQALASGAAKAGRVAGNVHDAHPPPVARRARVRPRIFRTGERRVIAAIAEAMFASNGETRSTNDWNSLIEELEEFLRAVSGTLRFGLRVALWIVSVAPLAMLTHAHRVERLAMAERIDVLRRLERSRSRVLALAFAGWRALLTILFYERPEELTAIGYPGEERALYKLVQVGRRAAPPTASADHS